MLKHADIWRAVDRLAQRHGLSPSGLAKRGGLDPTTFNKSKRETADGKLRWPSTESLAKVLDATGSSFAEFVGFLTNGEVAGESERAGGQEQRAAAPRLVPVIGYAQAGSDGYFDDAGYPSGAGWDELNFPDVLDEHAYALEISGDSMSPVYRDGDIIIVSPTASLRRGDRVVVRTRSGEVLAKQLARQTANRLELLSLNRQHPDRSLDMQDVAWMARIVWASQ
jgi:phage repressor protein C with HTH and peptisase S24 domain